MVHGTRGHLLLDVDFEAPDGDAEGREQVGVPACVHMGGAYVHGHGVQRKDASRYGGVRFLLDHGERVALLLLTADGLVVCDLVSQEHRTYGTCGYSGKYMR